MPNIIYYCPGCNFCGRLKPVSEHIKAVFEHQDKINVTGLCPISKCKECSVTAGGSHETLATSQYEQKELEINHWKQINKQRQQMAQAREALAGPGAPSRNQQRSRSPRNRSRSRSPLSSRIKPSRSSSRSRSPKRSAREPNPGRSALMTKIQELHQKVVFYEQCKKEEEAKAGELLREKGVLQRTVEQLNNQVRNLQHAMEDNPSVATQELNRLRELAERNQINGDRAAFWQQQEAKLQSTLEEHKQTVTVQQSQILQLTALLEDTRRVGARQDAEVARFRSELERANQELATATQSAELAKAALEVKTQLLVESDANNTALSASINKRSKEAAKQSLQHATELNRLQLELGAAREDFLAYKQAMKLKHDGELKQSAEETAKLKNRVTKLAADNKRLKNQFAEWESSAQGETAKRERAEKKAQMAANKEKAMKKMIADLTKAQEDYRKEKEAAGTALKVKKEMLEQVYKRPKNAEEKQRRETLKAAKARVKKLQIDLQDNGLCAICLDEQADTVFTRCGHTVCHSCAKQYSGAILSGAWSCYSCRLPLVSDRCTCDYFFMPSDAACKNKECGKERTVWNPWQCEDGHVNQLKRVVKTDERPGADKCGTGNCQNVYKPFELNMKPYHRLYLNIDTSGFDFQAVDDLFPAPTNVIDIEQDGK